MRISAPAGRVKTPSRELEHALHLLARDRKLLHDFVDGQAVFEVFEDDRHRSACALEHPRAAYLARDALDGRALGPVKRCHRWTPSIQITGKCMAGHVPSRCLNPVPATLRLFQTTAEHRIDVVSSWDGATSGPSTLNGIRVHEPDQSFLRQVFERIATRVQ